MLKKKGKLFVAAPAFNGDYVMAAGTIGVLNSRLFDDKSLRLEEITKEHFGAIIGPFHVLIHLLIDSMEATIPNVRINKKEPVLVYHTYRSFGLSKTEHVEWTPKIDLDEYDLGEHKIYGDDNGFINDNIYKKLYGCARQQSDNNMNRSVLFGNAKYNTCLAIGTGRRNTLPLREMHYSCAITRKIVHYRLSTLDYISNKHVQELLSCVQDGNIRHSSFIKELANTG